jgi:hypothetical protein
LQLFLGGGGGGGGGGVGIIFPVFENRYSLGLENLGINYKDFCFVLFLCNLILFTKNKRLITVLEFRIYELLKKVPKWVHMEKNNIGNFLFQSGMKKKKPLQSGIDLWEGGRGGRRVGESPSRSVPDSCILLVGVRGSVAVCYFLHRSRHQIFFSI